MKGLPPNIERRSSSGRGHVHDVLAVEYFSYGIGEALNKEALASSCGTSYRHPEWFESSGLFWIVGSRTLGPFSQFQHNRNEDGQLIVFGMAHAHLYLLVVNIHREGFVCTVAFGTFSV